MSSSLNECLGVRQVREIYLITYSQVNADLFPTRERVEFVVVEFVVIKHFGWESLNV